MAEKAPLRTRLSVPYEKALDMAKAALKAEGFGVLTEIDVKETLKAKIGVEFRKYDILGACNPSIAFMGLQRHLELGLLLPCNVIVYEEGDGSVVSIQDPGEMLGITKNPDLEEVADIARGHLERVISTLEGAG
jgi:uncharacterized protein (DUF302 family)